MPVLQDPDYRPSTLSNNHGTASQPNAPWKEATSISRRPTPTSPTTSPIEARAMLSNSQSGEFRSTNSREELIQCLKRGEHPTWLPPRNVQPHINANGEQTMARDKEASRSNIILPGRVNVLSEEPGAELADPKDIERPRSALHSGDFREGSPDSSFAYRARDRPAPPPTQPTRPNYASSLTTPWFVPTPARSFQHLESEASFEDRFPSPSLGRSRAPSLGSSHSSGFVYRAPTSPLVHSASNTELDLPAVFDKNSRRRTLPPEAFQSSNMSPYGLQMPNYSRPSPGPKRENSQPYQAHQPRRSLASNSFNDSPISSTPGSRSRGVSLSSEFSPLQHASMVGSYEESILRGRMSTTPSKPLDFVAQIGVLGRGDCKPSLRCPAHVSVAFPAVFYSYSSGTGRHILSDDSPSPYVGSIDLEHNLKPPRSRRRHASRPSSPSNNETILRDITAPENTPIGIQIERRKREREKRRSWSPMTPHGGCYRIPQQGQLQIVIKNPNKTAVKLFLIPYDLEGMEPGNKTFIRQRSYSHGPILEKPLSASANPTPAGFEKPTLRYLVHIRICSPSKGRFYLYDNIRVVFANRVPDGKEKLRNEVQVPEPRYSVWKPNKEGTVASSASAKLAADKASRRRSSGFGGTNSFAFGDIDGIGGFNTHPSASRQTAAMPSVPSIPPAYKHTMHSAPVPNRVECDPDGDVMDVDHPPRSKSDFANTVVSGPYSPSPQIVSGFNIGTPSISSQNGFASGSESGDTGSLPDSPYAKLRGQEGRFGSSDKLQGLLAQRLKGLDVRHNHTMSTDHENGVDNRADGFAGESTNDANSQ